MFIRQFLQNYLELNRFNNSSNFLTKLSHTSTTLRLIAFKLSNQETSVTAMIVRGSEAISSSRKRTTEKTLGF